MMFSILIAHYNNYEFFRTCYTSILQQSYQNFEVIILDDCSTDGSFDKIKNELDGDSRFKLHQNTENRGVGFTKKRCVELATGEICGFVDPDDALVADAVEICIGKYSNPEIVGTYSQINICDESLNTQKIFENTKKIASGNPLFFNVRFEISHFFTFRKKAYSQIRGINPELNVAEDMDLYLQFYDFGKIEYIPLPLYYYRVHKKGLSHDPEKENIKAQNWHQVILETLERRNIIQLYGKKISEIANLPAFISSKQNNLISKITRKFFG